MKQHPIVFRVRIHILLLYFFFLLFDRRVIGQSDLVRRKSESSEIRGKVLTVLIGNSCDRVRLSYIVARHLVNGGHRRRIS